MTELIQVFDGGLAQQVFLIGSAIFVALYACAILFLQRTQTGPRRTVFHAKTAMNALFLALAISVVANGLGVFHASSSGAAKGAVSISISELQRTVDMKSLPVQRVESLF